MRRGSFGVTGELVNVAALVVAVDVCRCVVAGDGASVVVGSSGSAINCAVVVSIHHLVSRGLGVTCGRGRVVDLRRGMPCGRGRVVGGHRFVRRRGRMTGRRGRVVTIRTVGTGLSRRRGGVIAGHGADRHQADSQSQDQT